MSAELPDTALDRRGQPHGAIIAMMDIETLPEFITAKQIEKANLSS